MRLLREQVAWIGKVGEWASEEQANGVYGTDFTVVSLAKLGARDRTGGPGIKVSFVEELLEVKRLGQNVIEGDR